MTNLAQLVNVLPLIVTTPEMAFPTAMYFPFLMYTQMQEYALNVKTESAEFESDAMGGNITAKKNVPYLDVTATTNSDQSKVVIGLVNRYPYSKMNVQIQTSGWEDLKPLLSTTLTSNPLDANTAKSPNKLHLTQTQKPNEKEGNLFGQLPPCSITVWEIDCQ
jgi:alpha-L-arabinofuranosidase